MHETTPLIRADLIQAMYGYGRPRAEWRIGAEFERLLLRPDGRAVGYDEPFGIRALMEALEERGWVPVFERGAIISMRRGAASVSLEPGGQVELSGSPQARLSEVLREALLFRDEIRDATRSWPLRQIAAGLTPFADIADIPWVPKSRYGVMREYLPRRGELAHSMMKGTCAVQASFDFSDEADCRRKVRASAGLAPLLVALGANSPLHQGKDTGHASYRAHIWTRTDPDRTGIPDALLDYEHERWVDWLLDVPMMFLKQGDRYVPAGSTTFRAFMERGIEGRFPSILDWDLHQTCVFPEVRVKHLIEVRSADCVRPELAVALCAMLAGCLYDDSALDQTLSLVEEEDRGLSLRERLAVAGLRGLGGDWARPILASARELLAIAREGLSVWAPQELALLDPLDALLERGRSPAEDLRDCVASGASPEQCLELLAI